MERYFVGVDFGGTNIKASIFNQSWDIVGERRLSTEADGGAEHVLNRIYRLVQSLIIDANLEEEQIMCMGIGVPGLLDIEKGISLFSPNFTNWENVAIVEWMEEHFDFPIFIDNDVRVNLYGEWYLGAGLNKKNVVLLTLGTGLGSGIVMDGRVLYGTTSSAGEVGHMNMYREGRACKCGSSGCLGRYASAKGMVRTFIEKLEMGDESIILDWIKGDITQITAKMISQAYDLDDKLAVQTLEETGEILGYGLVNIINLFNPEIIIIGGGMASAGERLLNKTREVVSNHALKISSSHCMITTAELGDSAGMIGAAIYAKLRMEEGSQPQ